MAAMPGLGGGQNNGSGRVPVVSAPTFTGGQREPAALRRAVAGPPDVVLAASEEGTGTSRLVREYLTRAEAQGLPSLPAARPLSPLADAISHATDRPPQPGRTAAPSHVSHIRCSRRAR